ncbi:cAMP-regulated D2 protein [Astyanax mexicanus]|uniref:cAMP-regulated D2 protein n=1 Tax=Astyanax mexicanus TaxID=7994 RepID=UPI0020CA9E24|nr:cAMP-regulated D2 protein [Astyanax mexicanus]
MTMGVYWPALVVCVMVCAMCVTDRTVSGSEEHISVAAVIRRVTAGVLVQGRPLGDPQTTGPRVLTKDGIIRGLTADSAHIFYKIPFADPPVGAYRWRYPRPVTPWRGERSASAPGPACMQRCFGPITDKCPKTVSEDCLYLNVFVPLSVNFSAPLLQLPVMVWIHGGDFIAGSASKPLYDSRLISNFTHTVVVSVAYRLGAFGFLVTGTNPRSDSVGNYGILDQQAALLWVKQNIAVFGGDPSKVTIFGESAGAQSVSLHLMIQSSKPLFNRAILQSLPFSIPLKTRRESLKLGRSFAKLVNCSLQDLLCLQALSAQTVLSAQIQCSSKLVNPFRFLEVFETWGPYLDGELIQEQAVSAFQRGHWQTDKPVLLGTTAAEGVVFVYGVFRKAVSALECSVYTTAIFKHHTLRILHKYFPLYPHPDHRHLLAQMVTDYVFLCPSRRSSRAAAQSGGSMWTYVFDHAVSDHSIWSGLTFCYDQSCHGAELPFLFGSTKVANFTMTPAERLLSNRMVCYWGSFAHSGAPSSRTPPSEFCRQQRPPAWPEYSASSGWLMMNLTVRSHAQAGSRNDICDFWDKLGIY